MTHPHTVAPTTKSGIALPEGSLSPSNYVGDPRLGQFIDWSSEFMNKGLDAPAEANEHGTPSVYMGKATGFGKLPGRAPLMPPEMAAKYGSPPGDVIGEDAAAGGTGTGNPYYPGITGDSPFEGSQAARPPAHASPSAQPAPAGVPPAKMGLDFGDGGRAMPFAAQLAPMFAAMGRAVPGQNARGPQNAAPTSAPRQEQHEPPPARHPLAGMMGADTWIDWEANLRGLMGEEQKPPTAPGEPPPPAGGAPAGPPASKPQPKSPAGYDVGGRGTGRKPFVYGRDDADAQGAQKSLGALGEIDELLKGLLDTVGEPLTKSAGAGSHKYVSRKRGANGWIYSYSHEGEAVPKPTSLSSADDHVAHALHKIGPKHGEHMEIHVSEPSKDGREAQRIGVHAGGHLTREHGHTKTYGPVAHTMHHGPPSWSEAGKAHDAFTHAFDAGKKRHGKDVAAAPAAKLAAKPPAQQGFDFGGAKKAAPAKGARSAESHEADNASLRATAHGPDYADKHRAGHTAAAEAHEAAAAKNPGQVGEYHARRAQQHRDKAGHTEKSMSTSTDHFGRPLAKGIYAFRGSKGDAELPDEYLYDYLCSFIEEAYEHERREPEHQQLDAKEQLGMMARAVMNELVQTIPTNANLMRATKKYRVTTASIEQILVAKGIYKPRADSTFTDDGNAAMGAAMLATGGAFAFSHQPRPFLVPEPAPVVARSLTPRGPEDASGLVKSEDPRDPHLAFQARHGDEVRRLWAGAASPVAQPAPSCPVHGGREIHKAMNLWNPMLPCTCSGKPNAHG
jgi:hypothetical protein